VPIPLEVEVLKVCVIIERTRPRSVVDRGFLVLACSVARWEKVCYIIKPLMDEGLLLTDSV
jgi:hypothetical protein